VRAFITILVVIAIIVWVDSLVGIYIQKKAKEIEQ
jgi:hypothetical protein